MIEESDFLVLGGGIMGLLSAWELARTNTSITLLEKGQLAKEASWAGGGIISPLYPWRYHDAVTALATWGQDYYPQLAAELNSLTGIDPELVQDGLLMMAVEDASTALAWGVNFERPIEAVGRAFIYDKLPHLQPGYEHGVWMERVAQIRNPNLVKALVVALRKCKNVKIIESTGELLLNRSEQTLLVHSRRQQYRGKTTILCPGAWANELLQQLHLTSTVEPVKGEMMLFKMPSRQFSPIILAAGKYLIPRLDGHVLVGSTLEKVGFNRLPSQAAHHSLLQAVTNLLPELINYPLVKQWSGLRPGTPSAIPYIGAIPGYERVFINAGHFRNGLVLAPASTRLLADLILDRQPILPIQPYDPMQRLVQVS